MMAAFSATTRWRRIALERQLPRQRFPAGVAVPSWISFCCLLLLAGLCVVVLGRPTTRAVEQAVVDSQKGLVADLARGLNAQAARTARGLAAAADAWAAGPAPNAVTLLTIVQSATSQFSGAAVLDGTTRKPIAVRGDAVPSEALPRPLLEPITFAIVGDDDQPRLVVAQPLRDGRILVTTFSVVIRPLLLNTDFDQTVLLAVGDAPSYSQGVKLAGNATALVHEVIQRSNGVRLASATRRSAEPGAADQATVVAAAPIGLTGVMVVSVILAPFVVTGSWWTGVPVGGALLVVAFLVLALIRFSLVLPVRRLIVRAKAIASGARGPRPRYPRTSEISRIVVAFDEIGARLRGRTSRPTPRRRSLSAGRAMITATLVVLAWSAAVTYEFNFRRPTPDVSQSGDHRHPESCRRLCLHSARHLG